jgi:type I restriction enzyme, S subunit
LGSYHRGGTLAPITLDHRRRYSKKAHATMPDPDATAALTTTTTADAPRPLPDGWRWARLGDVCEQSRQIVAPDSDLARTLPYLSMEHIESETGKISRESSDIVDGEGQSATFAFDDSHVLYGKLRPYLNKVGMPEFAGRCTTELIPLLPNSATCREYLAWILRRQETVDAAMSEKTGARMPRADMDVVLSMLIPLPPLAEQRRIAAILATRMAAVERARAAAQAQMEAAKALAAAELRAVFESAEAQEWPRVKLGDVCDIQLGKMLSPTSKTGTQAKPYLRNANVLWGKFNLSSVYEMDFSEDEERKFALKSGDLLVCEGGEPGRAAVWDEQITPCYYQKALHRLRPKDGQVDSHIVMYRLWFGNLTSEFIEAQFQTTIAHLPVVRLQNLSIPVPSISEQTHFAAALDARMAEIARLRESIAGELETIYALPAALLRQAFNGEL